MAKFNILHYVSFLLFVVAVSTLYYLNNSNGFVVGDSSNNSVQVIPTDRSYIDISGSNFGLPKKLISHDVDMSKIDSSMQDIYYNGISKLFNGFLYS